MSLQVFDNTRALAKAGPKADETNDDFLKRLFLAAEADVEQEKRDRAEFDALGAQQRAGSFKPYDIDVQTVDISAARIEAFSNSVTRLLVEAETQARKKALGTANAVVGMIVAGISGGLTAPIAIKGIADLVAAWS